MGGDGGGESKKDRLTDILVKFLDAQPRSPTPPSPEEAQRRHTIGRNYVIGSFNRHNDIEHDLACKIKLKQHAIALLPSKGDEEFGYLRNEALKVDMGEGAVPPYYRPIAADTPPIPGFDPSLYINEEEE